MPARPVPLRLSLAPVCVPSSSRFAASRAGVSTLRVLDDFAGGQFFVAVDADVEGVVEAGIAAVVHEAERAQEPFHAGLLVDFFEEAAARGDLGEEEADAGVDDHVRGEVSRGPFVVDEVAEHGVHDLVHDEAEEVCRPAMWRLTKAGL